MMTEIMTIFIIHSTFFVLLYFSRSNFCLLIFGTCNILLLVLTHGPFRLLCPLLRPNFAVRMSLKNFPRTFSFHFYFCISVCVFLCLLLRPNSAIIMSLSEQLFSICIFVFSFPNIFVSIAHRCFKHSPAQRFP